MSLNDRVLARLDAGVDDDVFERCAVALMAGIYDNVEPVEGGSDGGRDADIYAPIDGEPDSRGRILVTTGDMLDNLKSSHKTWEKIRAAGEQFRVDQLVMVTHKNLSDAKRRNVITYCEENSLPVPQFWTRGWLVEALRRNPEWRIELTGVSGRLEAVTVRPREASTNSDLIGRVEELDQLRLVVAASGDSSLVGLPGVGKSRLLASLEGETQFIDPLAKEYLAEDLIAVDPSSVILDDAHLHLAVLEEMVRLRSREQLGFNILASSWPGAEGPVEALLDAPSRLVVERLPRADLDSLIQTLGVHGVRARTLVLEQADGRPGWAVLLSRLVIAEDGEDLATGQSLLDQVAGVARSISGGAALNDALACVAALGAASLRDLEVIADVAGVSYGDLIDWLEATAHGGLVERANDRWSVLGPIRTLIVAATFFGGRKKRRWFGFAARFPDDPRLTKTLLKIAVVAPDPEARELVDAVFADVSTQPNDADALRMIELYAQIDEGAADAAAAAARRTLAEPREPQALYGATSYDPVGQAAESVLRSAFRRTCSREAAQGLLDLATTDKRARHQHPDHPMRVIQDLAQYLDPDVGPLDELRDRILVYALEWFDDAPSEDRWDILAEVARYVFDPRVEGNWADPGSHLSFTTAQGVMAPLAMGALLDNWGKIDERVRCQAGSYITGHAVAQLCEIFGHWSSLAVGVTGSAAKTSDEHMAPGARGAELVLATLARLADRFPGIPIRVSQQLERVALWGDKKSALVGLPILDDRLARYAGVRDYDEDVEAWMAQRHEERTSLAVEIGSLGPAEGVREYERLVKDASVLEGNHSGDSFASDLAIHVGDPDKWLFLAVDQQLPALVGPLLARARKDGLEVSQPVLVALDNTVLRASVLRTILQKEGDLDGLARQVLDDLVDGDALRIGELWFRGSVTPTLRELLAHPHPEVRALAAVAFNEGVDHGPELPKDLRPAWRTALTDANPADLPQHSRWRLEKMLKHAVTTDPELCADWFITNAATPGMSSRVRRTVESFAMVVRALPRDQKRRVCVTLGNDELSTSGFAGDVLGSEEILTSELFAEGIVDVPTLLGAMTGYRDRTVEVLSPVLLRAGVSPARIAARALSSRSWEGLESAAIRKDLTFFSELAKRHPELTEVCSLATSQLMEELESAAVKEMQEKALGW